jgi:hypothetical protein
MRNNQDELEDSLDYHVREYGRHLPRSASPPIAEEDLLERGFIHAGGTGTLLSRFTSRLRLDAVPDLCGNYTCLELRNGVGDAVRFRFTSLHEWDMLLTALDRENPRH